MALFGIAGEGGERLPHRATARKPRRHQVASPQRVSAMHIRAIDNPSQFPNPIASTPTPPPLLIPGFNSMDTSILLVYAAAE